MSLNKKNNSAPAVRNFMSDLFDTDRFFRDSFFPTFEKEWIPAVNVVENEKDYSIEMAAPGFNKSDIKVAVENGMLKISAERKEEKEEKEKNYTRREFNYNEFSRSFTLPENANEENLAAKYENGVLKLTIAKKVAEIAKKKEVQIA